MRRRHRPDRPAHLALAIFALALVLLPAPTASSPRPAGPTPPADGAFSLEQVMSSPFPTDLAAGPDGRFAWVQNAEGIRNIWVAGPPDWSGRPITAYVADDGQQLGDLQWTPDGSHVVFVRGGAPNRQGELPNPLSDPEGVERVIWLVAADAAAEGAEGTSVARPARLAEGSSPTVAPDASGVAFLRRDQVWWVDLPAGDFHRGEAAGSAEVEAAGEAEGGDRTDETGPEAHQLFEVRGGAGSLRWSPDGERLAFVSGRGDHSYVGVWHRDGGRIVWLDPGVDRDGSPTWSPDGDRVAFLRLPARGERFIFGPERHGTPWSIRVADPSSGAGREVWRADHGDGSVFHGVSATDQLMWAAGDLLVFPWERSGWVNLYAVPASGGAARALTPGEFEVEYVTLSDDGTRVLYNSNAHHVDGRRLWSVPVADGDPEPLTPDPAEEFGPVGWIEWAPTPAGDAVALFRSGAHQPAHAAVLVDGEVRRLAPEALPADFPVEELVAPVQVVFPAADGLQIHGQLFLPRDADPADDRPGLLFFHGGSRRQMLLGWHYLGYYHNAYAFNQYMASRGWAVLSVNYRSGTGYGMEFREAVDYGATGASEFNDVLGAGLWLRERPEVDPERIALWGGSYGGYLTALGLARASHLFAAGVDLHGVHDWNVVIRNFVPSFNPLEHPDAARTARESSPMASVHSWRSPVLLIHGDDDRNVPFSETVDLVEALRRQGVEHELVVFPDEVHGFLLHRRWLDAYRAAADFLERKLGAAPR